MAKRGPKLKTHCIHGHEYTKENTYAWKKVRHCRICLAARAKALNSTEKRKKRQKICRKQWVKNNPGCYRKWNLKKQYGMSLEDFDKLVVEQLGRCSICDKELFDPYVDHDHTTGKVRGLLCVNCNMGIGHFMDSKKFLLNAISYLEKHNAGKSE